MEGFVGQSEWATKTPPGWAGVGYVKVGGLSAGYIVQPMRQAATTTTTTTTEGEPGASKVGKAPRQPGTLAAGASRKHAFPRPARRGAGTPFGGGSCHQHPLTKIPPKLALLLLT